MINQVFTGDEVSYRIIAINFLNDLFLQFTADNLIVVDEQNPIPFRSGKSKISLNGEVVVQRMMEDVHFSPHR